MDMQMTLTEKNIKSDSKLLTAAHPGDDVCVHAPLSVDKDGRDDASCSTGEMTTESSEARPCPLESIGAEVGIKAEGKSRDTVMLAVVHQHH